MAKPIQPTPPIIGEQADELLRKMHNGEIRPIEKIDLTVSKETTDAVKEYIAKLKK